MRICILGSYSGLADEGMANVSYNLYHSLKLLHSSSEVVLADLNDIRKMNFWKKIISSKPDIIHYVPGPTLRGLAFAKILQILTRSKLVITATKPLLPNYFKRIAWLFRPDIIIVQSDRTESLFRSVKYNTTFIPNGVDTQRFVPADLSRKKKLRKEYNFYDNDFIVLHVGPLKKGRNQKALLSQLERDKILLITSITNPSEEEIYQDLMKTSTNVTIWMKYFPNIQEIYAIADVYVFPVFQELNSIEMPLSVLEAMSCNLPVITTRYGGLNKVLEGGEGLFFIQDEAEIKGIVSEIKKGGTKVNTREKIMRLSWDAVAVAISNVYENTKRDY
jgi:glycosyltransferase involved in cell wall biosynthesis